MEYMDKRRGLKSPEKPKELGFSDVKKLKAPTVIPEYLPARLEKELLKGGLPDVAAGGLSIYEQEVAFGLKTRDNSVLIPNSTALAPKIDLTPVPKTPELLEAFEKVDYLKGSGLNMKIFNDENER